MLINSDTLKDLSRGIVTSFKGAATAANQQAIWDKIATKVPSTTASNSYPWLGDLPKMREWIGDRHIKSFKAHEYTIVNRSWEATISVKLDDVEDDNYGMLSTLASDLANVAAQNVDDMVMEALSYGVKEKCYDGQAFFDSDHPVGNDTITTVSNVGGGTGEPWVLLDTSRSVKPLIYQARKEPQVQSFTSMQDEYVFLRRELLYGVNSRGNVGYGFWQQAFYSRQPLTEANFNAARLALRSFKSDEGRTLNIKPTTLVVNQANEAAAATLLNSQTLANGASNTLYNAAQVLVSPSLVIVAP